MASQVLRVSADSPASVIEAFIRMEAGATSLDVEKVVFIGKCESRLSPVVVNETPKEKSVGIFQINLKSHDISLQKAESPVWSTIWALNEMEQHGFGAWKICSEWYDKKQT